MKPRDSKNVNSEQGQKAETIAQDYLQGIGHVILKCNWRSSHLEVDIISLHDDTLVFTEVKGGNETWENLVERVGYQKQLNLAKAAEHFVELRDHEGQIRFDIICVNLLNNSLKHVEDAFFPSD